MASYPKLVHLAGYRRIRAYELRKWRMRFPRGSDDDVHALARWSARYGVAGLAAQELPAPSAAELAALGRLEATR